MSVELKIAKENDAEEWDKLVESSPHGTIFHTWKWLKMVEKHTKTKLYPVVGLRGTTPIGVYPLFYQKKRSIKLVFSPPPKALLLYLGPVLANYNQLKQSTRASIFKDFQKQIDEFITSELRYNYARICTSPGLLDSRLFILNGYEVEPLYTYMIDLSKGADYVWEQFNKQLRTDINKTKREGIVVEEGFKEDLDFLRKSLAKRYEEQGLRPSESYYEAYLSDLYDLFYPENMKIFIAKHKGENVGGLVSLCYKDKVALWIGIPKTELKGIYPNDLAQWAAIKWACEHGFKYYEEMSAGDDPRLRHFKAKFNPELALWFSAVKYSSPVFKVLEKTTRFVHSKRKVGSLT